MRRVSALFFTACLAVSACSGSEAEPNDSTVTSEVADAPVGTNDAGVDAAPSDLEQLACLPLAEAGWSTSDQLAGELSELVSMAANDQAAVILGSGSDLAATPYVSPDGLRWEAGTGLPRIVFGGPAVAVAGGPQGFVAVGTGNGAAPNTPIVAFSPDGATWEHLDPEDLPEATVAWMSDVVAGPQGFIIVGTRTPPLEEHDPGGLLVWVSSDGRTWTETDIPELGTGTADTATIAVTDAGWAAVTTDWTDDANSTVGVWTSSDGISWTEIETRGAPPATTARAYIGTVPLMVSGDRWVLTPVEGADSPTVWVSTDDGLTWSEHDVGGPPESTGFFVGDTAATEVGLILVGSLDAVDEQGQPFVSHSTDGTSWKQCPTTSEFSAAVPFGDGLILVDAEGTTMVWNEP